jgi:acetyl-CoA C-acetyltransferase
MKKVIIYDAVRTARGRGKPNGKLHTARPVHLSQTVLKAIQERNDLDTSFVNDVILGCVSQVSEQGGCIAKSAALYAGYDEAVSGFTLNRFCGSGLEAINQASSSIMSGYYDLIVAGGVESMSRVPIGSDGGAWMIDPDVASQTNFIPQGISADLIATLGHFSRTDVDRFAVDSQKKAATAWNESRFKSIVPVKDQNGVILLNKDEHMRPETTLESLSSLKPSFYDMGTKYGFDEVAKLKYPQVENINHVHHAGNASGIVDGASVALLGSEEIGKNLSLKPRAIIKSFSMVSMDPTIMLTGPAPACEKSLKACGMNLADIDLIEINEAFASVVLHFIREMKADESKINVNGGAIAFGHPLGATGAMLLGTVLDELERQDKETGMITLCIGGGMGISTIIERI